MTTDMMMGERDLEAELQEKDEIIMSLRLNEHLLKDKLEISRRNMSKQLERITALEKENIQLKTDVKVVLLILQAIGELPFKISVNEAKAIKRLSENVGELLE